MGEYGGLTNIGIVLCISVIGLNAYTEGLTRALEWGYNHKFNKDMQKLKPDLVDYEYKIVDNPD